MKNEDRLADALSAKLEADIPKEVAPHVVDAARPRGLRVVDVRQPGEPEKDYAANWLREWMGSR